MSYYDGVRIRSAEDLRSFQAVLQHLRRESLSEVIGFPAQSRTPVTIDYSPAPALAMTKVDDGVKLMGHPPMIPYINPEHIPNG